MNPGTKTVIYTAGGFIALLAGIHFLHLNHHGGWSADIALAGLLAACGLWGRLWTERRNRANGRYLESLNHSERVAALKQRQANLHHR